MSRNQGSSTQYLEAVRSNIASLHACEHVHRLQIGFFSTMRWVSFCFFAPSIHHIPKSHTLLRSRRAPVAPVPPLTARRSSLIRHAVAVGWTWSRSYPGVVKPCTSLASTCLCYRHSATLFAVDDPLLCGECGLLICVHYWRGGGVYPIRPEAQPHHHS